MPHPERPDPAPSDDSPAPSPGPATGDGGALRPWTPPALTELPPLTDLTLQTGSAIGGSGSTSDGGSTVF